MNKKIKNLFLAGALVLGLAGVAVSCTDYDSDIDALQKQINTLDQTVKGYDVPTLASTVDRLQKAIDGGAVITKVTPIAATATNPGGYEVTLSNGDKYVISNGAKGADGANGVTPSIKNGNWWIGNTDTGVKAQGANGENGQTPYIGANGNWFIGETDTQVKAQGADGADGHSPVITIGENGNWFIDDVDTEKPARGAAGVDGANAPIVWYTPDVENNVWVKNTIAADAEDYPNGPVVTEATDIEVVPDLEEKIAAVLSDQTLTFYITDEDGEKQTAVINLAPALKGLAFVPKTIFDGLGLITVWEFYAPKNNKAFPFVTKTSPDGVATNGADAPKFITTAPADVTYRMDASNVDIAKYDWDFVNRTVYTRAIADKTDLVTIVNGPVKDTKDGSLIDLKIQLNKAVAPAAHGKTNDIVALRATDGEGEPVVSDYAYIDNQANYGYSLIHKDDYKVGDPKAYRTDFVKISDPTDYNDGEGLFKDPEGKYATPVLVYNDEDGIDLLDYVETFADQVNDLVSTTGLVPTYKFFFAGQDANGKVIIDADAKKATYLTEDADKTNQNEFVTLNGSIVKVNADFVSALRPAIGRTPLIYAQSCYGDYILAEGFIKIKIVEEAVEPQPEPKPTYKVFIKHAGEFDIDKLAQPTYKGTKYLDYPDDNYELNVIWSEMNVKMFNELGMSYEQFLNNYDTKDIQIIVAKGKDGKNVEPGDLPDEGEFDATVSYGEIDTIYGEGHTTFSASPGNPQQNTNMVSLSLDNKIAVGGPHYVYVLYKSKSALYPNAVVKFVYNVKEHVHRFSIGSWLLNPDYILGNQNELNPTDPKDYKVSYAPYNKDNKGYGAVRIKGQEDLMRSGLLEHFENYLKNEKDNINVESVYTFLIKNFTTAEVAWKTQDVGTVENVVVKIDDKTSETHSKLTLTGEELLQIIAEPQTTPYIELGNEARISKGYDVLVEVTEACTTPEHIVTGEKSKVGYYFVVFKALDAKLALKDVKLGTFKEINDYVLLTELVEGIYDGNTLLFSYDETGKLVATEAAAEYGMSLEQLTITLNSAIIFDIPKDPEESFGTNLYVVAAGATYDPSTTTKADVDGINWWNLGTDLQVDKNAHYEVTVKYGEDELVKAKGLITVLATAKSIHPLHDKDGALQEPLHNKDGEIYAIAEPETTEGEGEGN